jgi:hypothetical protein
MPKTIDTAELRIGDKTISSPSWWAAKASARSTSASSATTGLITFDPGYANTGACRSAITFIDGDAGILRYRGYSIEDLAEKSSFLEVSHLLIYGELPTEAQLRAFSESIRRHTMLHEDFSASRRDAEGRTPMAASPAAVARSRPTPTRSIRAIRDRSRSPCTGCSRSSPRWPPTPSSTRSASRSCTPTTSSATSATSCT